MRKLSLVALMSLSLIMAGCKADAEAVLNDTIAKMNEMTAILKTVTDQNSSKAAATKLKAVVEDLKEIKKRDDKIRISESEKKRLLDKHSKELADMKAGLTTQMTRIMGTPGAMTPELAGVIDSMGALMK